MPRRLERYLGVILSASFLGFVPTLSAEETEQPAAVESSAPGADFDKLISGLDSEEFAERQAASQKLAEQGLPALPALEQGAANESREVSQRSLELIKKLFESTDEQTKQQAKEALERLAKSEQAALASRAKNILEPPQPMADPNRGVIRLAPIQGRVQIQVQGQFNGGGGRRVTTRTVNGVRDIEAQDNDRKVKIHDDPNNGIQVEVTEKKDGKEETKKYEAKNLDELKKNHPDAAKVYEEFGKQGAGNAIQLPIPAGVPGINQPDILKRRLEGTERALQGVQRAIDQLEQQKDRLQKTKEQLEKEISDAEKPKTPETPAEKPAAETPATEEPAEAKSTAE